MNPPEEPSAASFPQTPAPAPSSGAVPAVAEEAPPSLGAPPGRVIVALQRFLASRQKLEGRDLIRAVVLRKLYGRKPQKVDAELVDELVTMAALRAHEAHMPPWTESGIPGWVTRLTRCTIADYFRARKVDDKYLDRSVGAAMLGGDRHGPAPDWGAREHLIAKYLDSVIGDSPRKKETFRLMMEKEVAGRTLAEIAAEHHTTERALTQRFYKLRQELIPHASLMDEEKPRRTVLVLLWLFGLGTLLAIAYFLLLAAPPPAVPATPLLRPAPTVTAQPAPPPSFDQAQPPELQEPQPKEPPGTPRP